MMTFLLDLIKIPNVMLRLYAVSFFKFLSHVVTKNDSMENDHNIF